MRINKGFRIDPKSKNEVKKQIENISKTVSEKVKKAPAKAKYGAIIAMFLLPTLGIVNKCTNDKKTDTKTEYVENIRPSRDNYVEKSERTFYAVQKGDNPEKIAKKFNVSTRRLMQENGLKSGDIIHPNDTLLIPESITVKNIKTSQDVSNVMGFSENFVNQLISLEKFTNETYKDKNGNATIGVGHLIKPDEAEKYKNKVLSDEEVYTLLAQDLLNFELDLKTIIGENTYDSLKTPVKESVMDLIFNKGLGAVNCNEILKEALINQDNETVIKNLTQDFSIVTNAKGEKVKKPLSGLNKRRLFDISNAAKIYGDNVPKSVLETAKKVYEQGLVNLKNEKDRGDISAAAYPNVLEEYKGLAYEWFNGKIGEKSELIAQKNTASKKTPSANNQKVADKKISVNGEKTDWTVESLHEEWNKSAKAHHRVEKRPKPEVDAKGNVVATVKTLEPTAKGKLSGKTFIINAGHGGCVGNITTDKKGKSKLNVNFDPGASNAVMKGKNKNTETNTFIGNGGKPLEEWVVNMKIANDLTEKIRKQGGKVIYVQGSVYTAKEAIRNLAKNKKANMVISLHSNSAGSSRGILVIGSNRGGVDLQDKELAQNVENRLNEHNSFKGFVKQTEQSLAVLSADDDRSLDIPAILIETGNLKNKIDVDNLNSSKFRGLMANAIVDGIKDYLK